VITAAIFALNLYTIIPAQADTDHPPIAETGTGKAHADAVNQGMSDVETTANDVEKLIDGQKKQIRDLQKELEQKQVLQNKSDEERKALSDSLNAQVQYLNLFAENWKEYKGNVHALQAEATAKKYLPWGYALAAVLLFKRNTWQDEALVGLAGYGTGALIEQSDWGIGHFAVKTLFRLGYSF
jgi:Skp family chaperone for outer membrane proteins